MVKRSSIVLYLVLGCLCLTLAGNVQAQQVKPGIFIYIDRDSIPVGFFHALKINVDSLALFIAQQRRIDSTIAANAGVPQYGEQLIRLNANFGNQTNDSANLTVGVGGVFHAYALPYDMYLDRFILHTAQPNGRSPSTFRSDLPPVSTDSTLIFRLSRNASFAGGVKTAITVYKVALTAGLSFTSTAGVFYDMVRFDEAVFPAAGTSVQVIIHLTLKKNR